MAKTAINILGNHPKAMRQTVASSLKRLKTDYIDIYMPHCDDDDVKPLEDFPQFGRSGNRGKKFYQLSCKIDYFKSSDFVRSLIRSYVFYQTNSQ